MKYDEPPSGNDEPTFNRPKPPQPEQELITVLRDHAQKTKEFPSNYQQAAVTWIGLMEPQKTPHELPQWEPRPGKQEADAGHWLTPYIDRLRTALNIFLSMNQTEQAFIVHHIKNGVPYRGDSIDIYREIIKNTSIMREAVAEHGRGPVTRSHPGGTLPARYTNEIITAMARNVARTNALPYDKNERGGELSEPGRAGL